MFNRKNRIENLDTYVEERLSDYLDATLPAQERAIVEAHLAESERARASLDSLRYTVNLLRQTPAPQLPRQFTLPVTSRAARVTPGWLVWGLRGVAIGATASFVILLSVTLLRQQPSVQTANAPAAAALALPTAIVAFQQPTLPPAATAAAAAAEPNQPAAVPSPLMITTEAEESQEIQLLTVTPDAASSKVAPTEPQPLLQAPPAAPPAPIEQPTQATTSNFEFAQPTEAPAANDNADVSAAAGSAEPANTPVFDTAAATGTVQADARRTVIQPTTEGVVIDTPELRVREGAGIDFDIIGSLKLDDRVRVVGRDANSNWLAIEFPQNLETGIGWVGATFMQVNIPLDLLTVLDNLGLPVKTATPTTVGQQLEDELTATPTGEAASETATSEPEPSVTP